MNQRLEEWRSKANTVGVLPGKAARQLEHLQQIAHALPLNDDEKVSFGSKDSPKHSVLVSELCGQILSRTGFFLREQEGNRWSFDPAILSEDGEIDPVSAAVRLHTNLKFFGELVKEIGQDTHISDLQASAAQYGLDWSSKDQIRRRIVWAKTFELIEQWSFGGPFRVTAAGERFLTLVQTAVASEVAPSSKLEHEDVELDVPSETVRGMLEGLDEEALANRRTLIGYIPKGANAREDRPTSGTAVSPIKALRAVIDLVGERISIEDFARECASQFKTKKTSFDQTLHTCRNLGLIEPVAYNEVAPTDLADELLVEGRELDFVRFLHVRFAFIGELLAELSGISPSADLTHVARHRYGLHQMKAQEIRTRFGFLLDAGLVERIDWKSYRLGSAGQALLQELKLAEPGAGPVQHDDKETKGSADEETGVNLDEMLPTGGVEEFLQRLHILSTSDEKEFELGLAEAFRILGFEAEHVGGNRETDVVLVAHLGVKSTYRVTVEAKTSRSGVISESQVIFQGLKQHRKDRKADAGVIVAPGFPKRLREYASAPENSFGTLTVEELSSIIRLHAELPLTTGELALLFSPDATAVRKVSEKYERESFNRKVIASMITLLHTEASDENPMGDGSIMRSQLSYGLHRELRPSLEVVNAVLDLLTSPLVRAVEIEPERSDREPRGGDKFRMTDSPKNIRDRLSRLGVTIADPT